jgi:YD repeat-containing protein
LKYGCLIIGALLCTFPVSANEIETYSHDALGRLVKVTHSGSTNNGNTSSYQYDAAGNRKNVTVVVGAKFVVVRMGSGFKLIPVSG